MKKITASLIVFMLALTLAPFSFAKNSDDQPLWISKGSIETDGDRVKGYVRVCNRADEDVRATLDVKNESINALYKRNILVDANQCENFELGLTDRFKTMSNTGDDIRVFTKYVREFDSSKRYEPSDEFWLQIEEGDRDSADCSDKIGDDAIYFVCEDAFIYHEPSGLRFKVIKMENRYMEIMATHIRWGGVKDFRVYRGRKSKPLVSGDEEATRVIVSNVYEDGILGDALRIRTIR
jgi:hypothetical protein